MDPEPATRDRAEMTAQKNDGSEIGDCAEFSLTIYCPLRLFWIRVLLLKSVILSHNRYNRRIFRRNGGSKEQWL